MKVDFTVDMSDLRLEQIVREMRERRSVHIQAEIDKGEKLFLGIPDRWYDVHKFRCYNGHVSTMVLKSEALGGDACLECYSPVLMTFPEDEDDPVV